MAELCLKLGFRGHDLGYQTFFYGNEHEIRTIFMFLMDQLPKDDQKKSQTVAQLSQTELKKREIKDCLKSSHDTESQENSEPFDAWSVENMTDAELFRLLPKETRAAALDAKIKLSTLIQNNEEQKNKPENTLDDDEIEKVEKFRENTIEILASSEKGIEIPFDNSDLPDFSQGDVENSATNEIIKPQVPDQDSKMKTLKLKKEKADQELQDLFKEYKIAMKNLKQQKKHLSIQELNYQDLIKTKSEKETILAQRLKVLDLVPSGEENIKKLREIIAKKKTKMIGFQEQWETHKQSLLEDQMKLKSEIEKLKLQKNSSKNEDNSLKGQIENTKKQIEKQNLIMAKLKKQLENSPKEYLPRAEYTKKIMDILNNVSKQKKETTKVIEEIRFIQKDINSLEGKLSRTYADADHILFEVSFIHFFFREIVFSDFFSYFQQAKKDKVLVPAYKILVEIHKSSDDIIEDIRESGKVKRQTQALIESANVEKSKKINDKIAKLEADLNQIRQECAEK